MVVDFVWRKKDRGKYGQLQNFKLIEICIKYSIDMMKISSAGYPNTHEIIEITGVIYSAASYSPPFVGQRM